MTDRASTLPLPPTGAGPAEELRHRYTLLRDCPGPRDQWREAEDFATARGNSLSLSVAAEVGVCDRFLQTWFRGISFDSSHAPPVARVENYSSVLQDPDTAGKEMDRLTGLGKIHWYHHGAPPDLRVCPSKLIIKPDKVRLVHDWSCANYPLNSLLPNPPVNYGTMDSFLAAMGPGSWMAGIDFRDCFLHWPIGPACRRWLGIKHPVTGLFGCYLFLPFGLGPAPGWNDICVKEVLRVAALAFPDLVLVDYVDDIRMVHTSSYRDPLQHDFDALRDFLKRLGVIVHVKPKKLFPPTQVIPWLGFIINTYLMEVQLDPDKRQKGLDLIRAVVGAPNHRLTVKELLACVGFLNYLEWLVPGGFAHLRSSWDLVNTSGVYDDWKHSGKANPVVTTTPGLRNDLLWWDAAIRADPVKPIHSSHGSCFVWHTRLADLKDRVLAQHHLNMHVWHTDASGRIGWGATYGNRYIQGKWDASEAARHINWKELSVVLRCLEAWGDLVTGQAVLVRMDNTTAICYVNYGSGRVPELTALGRSIKTIEARRQCLLLGLHVAGAENTIADALSRYTMDMCRIDPHPDRKLRSQWFARIQASTVPFDWDMMAEDDGSNAQLSNFRCPSNSAFEKPYPEGNLWWFPPFDLAEPTLRLIRDLPHMGWKGTSTILVPESAYRKHRELCRDMHPVLTIKAWADPFLYRDSPDEPPRVLYESRAKEWVCLHRKMPAPPPCDASPSDTTALLPPPSEE